MMRKKLVWLSQNNRLRADVSFIRNRKIVYDVKRRMLIAIQFRKDLSEFNKAVSLPIKNAGNCSDNNDYYLFDADIRDN